MSELACETASKEDMVMVVGEITTKTKLDYEEMVRGVVAPIGFDSHVDDLCRVDNKGLCDETCGVLVRIDEQSPDTAGGAPDGNDISRLALEIRELGSDMLAVGCGLYAPHPILATRLGKVSTEVREGSRDLAG